MSSLPIVKPDEARTFLQEAAASLRKVQVAFVSIRSDTHFLIRGTLEETLDRMSFVVREGKHSLLMIDVTQASVCRIAGPEAARDDPMAERFFPTLQFTSALILGFKEVERLAVFVIASDKAN